MKKTEKMTSLPRISVIVCTRDRPRDLVELLQTIVYQDHLPFEVIIIDDSPICSAEEVVNSFYSNLESLDYKSKYVRGSGDGLPSTRNLGVEISRGDAILFLDDDTLLSKNVVSALASFFRDNPVALGVQPKISQLTTNISNGGLAEKFGNLVYKALMLSYWEKNRLMVRRSGESVKPNNLTKVISVQRLFGCCCYRRRVFRRSRFDTNLKRWGYMEDLDFSYRVSKKNPKSLYAIPHAEIIHKTSGEARLPSRTSIYMTTIYWSYVFFKDIFERSFLNLVAFMWALIGNLASVAGGLLIKKKPKREWWTLIHLLGSYIFTFKHLRSIKRGNLEFFNRTLPT